VPAPPATRRARTKGHGDDRRSLTDRIFRILDCFAATGEPLSTADVTRQTGLPKTTVHRIVDDLVSVGVLARLDGRLHLGTHLFELGSLVPPNRELREAALPFMEDLYEATHEIVHLGILDGSDVLYLVKISGHDRVPVPTRDGARLSAHAVALGKALLAASPKAVVRRVLAHPLPAMTPNTIVDPAALLRELAQIAQTAVAFDREEAFPGVVCAAAAITLPRFPGRAAISVTGARGRFDPDHAAAAVRLAAFAISRSLENGSPTSS